MTTYKLFLIFTDRLCTVLNKSDLKKPATRDDITYEPLWHNKFITTKIRKRECTLYLSNWIKSGMPYVKDLQFTNGKVD